MAFPVRAPRRHVPPLAAATGLIFSLFGLFGMAATAGAAAAAPPGADDVIGGPLLGEPGIVVDPTAWVPHLPATTATSFIVADADTGDVLAAKNAHQKLAPASTLKVLTALTLLPHFTPSVPTTVHSDAPEADGTKVGVVAGQPYKLNDLMTAMLMMSANDAAVALADANGGLPKTLAQMNAEAAYLQADDTVAKTPNGLDAAGQSSSAYDLALFFRAGLAQPQFRHYLALTRANFPAPGGTSYQIQTHDKLLARYTGMVGGKNGYTVAAQASYVGAATRGGHTIIVAVMRDQPNFWDEVGALLDWGFAADGVAQPIATLVGPLVPSAPPTQSPAVPSADRPAGLAGGAGAGGAGVAGGRATAAGQGHHGSSISALAVLTWVAVGLGGLVFLGATVQLGGRAFGRRRRRKLADTDDRYLRGLSRLSALGEITDRL